MWDCSRYQAGHTFASYVNISKALGTYSFDLVSNSIRPNICHIPHFWSFRWLHEKFAPIHLRSWGLARRSRRQPSRCTIQSRRPAHQPSFGHRASNTYHADHRRWVACHNEYAVDCIGAVPVLKRIIFEFSYSGEFSNFVVLAQTLYRFNHAATIGFFSRDSTPCASCSVWQRELAGCWSLKSLFGMGLSSPNGWDSRHRRVWPSLFNPCALLGGRKNMMTVSVPVARPFFIPKGFVLDLTTPHCWFSGRHFSASLLGLTPVQDECWWPSAPGDGILFLSIQRVVPSRFRGKNSLGFFEVYGFESALDPFGSRENHWPHLLVLVNKPVVRVVRQARFAGQ